jgi:hypothetical protein
MRSSLAAIICPAHSDRNHVILYFQPSGSSASSSSLADIHISTELAIVHLIDPPSPSYSNRVHRFAARLHNSRPSRHFSPLLRNAGGLSIVRQLPVNRSPLTHRILLNRPIKHSQTILSERIWHVATIQLVASHSYESTSSQKPRLDSSNYVIQRFQVL